MGWNGSWNLEYTGKNNEKFVNVAKLVITNFKKRFEISDDKSVLDAVKRLSWYSADMDIERILSYLDDGDEIHVLIDGETHPYDDNDEELEFEEQTYRKENGEVTMECEYEDCDRYQTDRHGMKGSLIYELSYPDMARQETIKGGFTNTLDTYIEWIAQEMGDREEMMPIIQDFMNEIMNISRDEVVEENGVIDEKAFAYFNEIKAKFKSLESTREYISEIREKLPPKEQEAKVEVPDLFANMSKRDVKQLGGMEQLIELYEKEGEQKTRELLEVLGYDLNSGKKGKNKKQSSVAKRKAENEINKNIKQSVIDYFLGCIKEKYPNLTPENEEAFAEALGETIDHKLEFAGWDCSFNIDYDPCDELISAFYSMDMDNFDSGLPIHGVFPWKTHVRMERGKSATVSSEYGESGILYMTDEHRQELLTSVNTRIMIEESKIPQEVREGFEEEYQTIVQALDIQRNPLVKKQEETQRILDQKKALEVKARQLIESYASRIDELDTLGLSEDEKEKRKQAIITEIKQTQEAARSNKFREQLGEIEEKYGWDTLASFDDIHKEELDKEAWMRKKYIRYGIEMHQKVWEEHRKKHSAPGDFSFPDTSAVPTDLDRLYAQREQIAEYDRRHEEKLRSEEQGQENINNTEEQQAFIQALGEAYAQYMKEHGNIDEYSFRNGREQILTDAFSKYFAANYENLTNSAFLVDFENGDMRQIAEERGFKRKSFGWGFDSFTDGPHIKVSEGLIYSVDGLLDKADIKYGTQEAIQSQIDKLDSEIRFMKDTEKNTWEIRRLESQRDSFVSYQRTLQGKTKEEPSLEELDGQKHMLEAIDEKTEKLLQQLDNNRTNQQEVEINGIEIDD